MPEVKARFIERVHRTYNVESFRFVPSEKIDFKAGQFMQIMFNPQDKSDKVLNKYLSLSCLPAKEYIEVTKKISESDFSKKLMSLNPGDEVLIKAPMGNCVFSDEIMEAGFIVGGIGITPVISMLSYLAEKKSRAGVVVLYSNWTQKDIAFNRELDSLGKVINLRVEHILVEGDKEKYSVGMIDKDFIANKVPDYAGRTWFILGPPAMVKAMKAICYELQISDDKLITESFMGY